MSERLKGYVVVLKNNIRKDDAEGITDAIRMIRGIISVEPIYTNLIDDQIVEMRVRTEIREKIYAALNPGWQHD